MDDLSVISENLSKLLTLYIKIPDEESVDRNMRSYKRDVFKEIIEAWDLWKTKDEAASDQTPTEEDFMEFLEMKIVNRY